jgi:hypothetical protein
MADIDPSIPTDQLPDVRAALRRAFQHGREPEELLALMDEIREITFFEDYMSMKVLEGPLLERLESDEALRSDVELSLSAAFGRSMALKVHRYV